MNVIDSLKKINKFNDMKLSDYISLYNEIRKMNEKEVAKYKDLKVCILRSFTYEQIEPIIGVECFKNGFYPEILIGGYNQYTQEVLDKNSFLYKFNPNIIIMAVRLEEMYKTLYDDYIEVVNDVEPIKKEILNKFDELIRILKDNTSADILIHNFITPMYPYFSLYDFQTQKGLINLVRSLNLELVYLVKKYSGVYIIDMDYLASIYGKENIYDKNMWYMSRNPYKMSFYMDLSKEYLKYIRSIYGIKKKCIVLDLDNTLWGGIVGEDGFDGIKLGDDYPGRCYKDFQKELLKLNKRGIILAVNSKNNFDDAIKVINEHPDMILREENFACLKINWTDKATNLMEICQELNIGLDSILFIDDNPAECELIRQALPEVEVINLPTNLTNYKDIINEVDYFETLNLTDEDLKKADMYKRQVKRDSYKKTFTNLKEYYKSLEMEVTIKQADDFSIPRIAQLTQKTNQFNLTTRRYTEEDVRSMLYNNFNIYSMNVSDKFGDNGITGVAIVEKISSDEWYIDSFLLSCRIMNRTLENVLLWYIYEEAKKAGVIRLIGRYIPTSKNIPVKDFYKNLNFKEVEDKYVFDIKREEIRCPSYVKVFKEEVK